MSRSLVVIVPGRPPGANDLIRMGHWRIGKVRAQWKETTMLAVADAQSVRTEPWRPLRKATVEILWRCRYRRRRDFDNLVSGIKPLLDGLVAAGVIEDDSSDVLVSLGPLSIEVGTLQDEVVMTVREA